MPMVAQPSRNAAQTRRAATPHQRMEHIDMSIRNSAGRATRIVGPLVLSAGMLLGAPATAGANNVSGITDFCGGAYDNASPQTSGLFTDLRRGPQINADTESCVLNLSGSTGSAGDLWITLLAPPSAPALASPPPLFACVELAADVRIKRYDNRKAVGFVTHYDAATQKGLFLGLYDNGNSDAMTLSSFDGATGKLTATLANVFLGSKVKENTWYTLQLGICSEGAQLVAHASMEEASVDTTYAAIGAPCAPGQTCLDVPFYPLTAWPAGISPFGQIGIAGYAKSAFVDSSVTDFSWTDLSCLGAPGFSATCCLGQSGDVVQAC
jgi:hypothetical protein